MKEKIDQAQFNGIEINKATIAQWLDRDLDGLLSLLFAIRHSEMIKGVVIEWLYENHIASKLNEAAKARKEEKAAMESALKEEGGQDANR